MARIILVAVDYLADCRLPTSTIVMPAVSHHKEFAYLLDPASHVPSTKFIPIGISKVTESK